jgi:acetolactate synthase-1/3 small subunit
MQKNSERTPVRTFVASLEDSPGVLNRVSSLFRRRKYNIISLSVGRTHQPGISRMTLMVEGDEQLGQQLTANLRRLVCVLDVQDVTDQPSFLRDLALIKLRVSSRQRMEVFQLASVFEARVIDVQPQTMIIETTAPPDRIEGLLEVLEPFGIEEMVQCGAVAISANNQPSEAPMQGLAQQALGQQALGENNAVERDGEQDGRDSLRS